MAYRPFRFGVQLANAATRRDWVEKVRLAEKLGYTSLLMPDHFNEQLGPIPALITAAECSSMRIGTLVLDNDYRHPIVLAKEAATIDLLTEGRLELGIGAGWMRADYEWSGMPYDRASVRIDRFEEAITIFKGALGVGPFSFEGNHYTIKNYEGAPKPVQNPHPPIIIGGGGKRVLGIAAREANIIGINPNYGSGVFGSAVGRDGTGTRADDKVRWVREAAGSRFGDIELSVLIYTVAKTHRRRSTEKALASRYFVSKKDLADFPHALIGTVEQIAETIQHRRERWGISYYIVGEAAMADFAPIVAGMAGR